MNLKIKLINLNVSATPAEYELSKSNIYVINQLIRPTGLLDPIKVCETQNQIDYLIRSIRKVVER